LKNMKVNGKDDIPYIMEKKMFETTNQVYNPKVVFPLINPSYWTYKPT